jgi:Pyridine nucleotide-disulphide oxidoreductase
MNLRAIGCTELLSKMAVPGYTSTYALGLFAKRVTVRSQQVRALNLIRSLVSSGRICKGGKILVVGAGFAGLTAAAAAVRAGCHVTILERSQSRLSLQRNCSRRYLHPRIYDWPHAESTHPDANLPLLNWKANMADEVVKQIDTQFDKLLSQGIKETFGVGMVTILQNGEAIWKEKNANIAEPFDALILAIGFGLEPETAGMASYWSEPPLDMERERESEMKVLISGRGDGALTDLMRACLLNFRHDEVLKHFAAAPGIEEVKRRVMEIEKALDSEDEAFLSSSYTDKSLDLGLTLALRKWRVFWAPGSEAMFGPNSSALNRFIVSQMFHAGAFQILMQGKTASVDPLSSGGFKARFSTGYSEDFDIVVLRHGPSSAFERDFPQIANACAQMREQWKSAGSDWTDRLLLETEGLINPHGITPKADPRDAEDVDAVLRLGYKIGNVANRETVIVVIGTGLWPELLDRPAAEVVWRAVSSEGKTRFQRAIVLSDAAWEKTPEVHENPVISIGGPVSNLLTDQLKDDNRYELAPDIFASWKRYFGMPRVALWGDNPEKTRRAVVTYVERPEGLRAFLRQSWT